MELAPFQLQDVAAATFMATATTMPEFFTNVISTFVTESDIGLGTIIGSLMFNTLGVASLASIAARKPLQLDWWPITRDCTLYSCNILLLVVFSWDGIISLDETAIMVVLYFVYFVILFQNKRVMPKVKWFLEDYLNCCKVSSYGKNSRMSALSAVLLLMNCLPIELPSSFIEKNLRNTVVMVQPDKLPDVAASKGSPGNMAKSSINNAPIFMIYSNAPKSEETEKKVRKSLWRVPMASRLKTVWWAYTWPIKFILTMTIPNPKTYRKLYPLTFIMCVIWIGVNAYMIVWMISIIGERLSAFSGTFSVAIHPSFILRLHVFRSGCRNGTHTVGSWRLYARRIV